MTWPRMTPYRERAYKYDVRMPHLSESPTSRSTLLLFFLTAPTAWSVDAPACTGLPHKQAEGGRLAQRSPSGLPPEGRASRYPRQPLNDESKRYLGHCPSSS